MPNWFEISNPDEVDSPALLIYEARVEENLRRMVKQVGDVARLRPHIKTHKLPQLVERHLAHGITRFKAATIAEAEMCAQAGAPDVLLAYPPVGPRATRLATLIRDYPRTRFSTLVDHPDTALGLSRAVTAVGVTVEVLLDLDCGQHRTGIAPGEAAAALYQSLGKLPGLIQGGLHVYDGHLHETDVAVRRRRCEEAFAPVELFQEQLLAEGYSVPRVVAGGTPTFPFHAERRGVECSPGTCVFWDHGYGSKLPDLDYLPAAVVLTRVVSKPLPGRLCLDLGHKAIASEMAPPRVLLLNLPDVQFVGHNEEHLIVETPAASSTPIGAVIYGVPWHVCPTVALHQEVVVVRDGRAAERWQVSARSRRLQH